MSWMMIVGVLTIFSLVLLASHQVGKVFSWAGLPLISGFLVAGILAGPHVSGLLSAKMVSQLGFLDELSLAFIAFAAGNELHLSGLKGRLKSISYVTFGLVFATFLMGSLGVFMLSGFLPFMKGLSPAARFGVSLLAGAILVARSPSSAIALVKETQAKGPFTQTALGVTMLSDILVIILFSISFSVAGAFIAHKAINGNFLLVLSTELALSVLAGLLVGGILAFLMGRTENPTLRAAFILLLGYGVFAGSGMVRIWSHEILHVHFHLEPLLICMIGSFMVTNFTRHQDGLSEILHQVGPHVYLAFFTLTGASLALNVLAATWHFALVLFLIRLVSIWLGSYAGSSLAKEPKAHTQVSWMVYLTQAGVGLGLAKQVANAYPSWGMSFATTMVAVIIFNQFAGPPLFKWAIQKVGEGKIGKKKQRKPSHFGSTTSNPFQYGAKGL